MSEELEEPVRRALREARLELTLDFQRTSEGAKGGTVTIRDADGATVATAGHTLAESKHTPEGLERRRSLLAAVGVVLPGAVPGVPEADLLEAAAGAWTAARYATGEAEAFPADHPDRLGAIWA